MKTFITSLLLILLFASKSFACLNYYTSVDQHGQYHTADHWLYLSLDKNFNHKLIQQKLIDLEAKLKKEKSYKLLSDYAVLLLKAGKTKEPLKILIELAKHYPSEYQIAANLGTAYELNGDNENALIYIKKGIELNPNSHGGSEWVHVKILETKIALKKNPGYLKQNTILGLTQQQKSDSLILSQILTQVKERFPFSPSPDQIMGNLLIDLGDCFSGAVSYEYAKAIYTLAKEYHGIQTKTIDAKIAEMLRLRKKYANTRRAYETNDSTIIREGDEIIVKGIRYKDLLKDHNAPPFSIDWKKINTDVSVLLEYANLKAEATTSQKADTILKGHEFETRSKTKASPPKKAPFFIFGGVAFIILIAIAARKRNKRAR